MRRLLVGVSLFACACGGNSTAPSTTTTSVPVGPTLTSVAFAAPISSMTKPGNTGQVTATGTFNNGTTSNVTASCTGWQSDNVGVLTVNGSGLLTAVGSGTSTITATCQGVPGRGLATLTLIPDQLFTISGKGDFVFTLPSYVASVHVHGHFVDTGSNSNFIVSLAGRGFINEILRQSDYDGVLLSTGGGQVVITNSGSIQWSFTEVR